MMKMTEAQIMDLLKELCRISLWQSFFIKSGVPRIDISYRKQDGTTGLAHWYENRISVGIGDDCDLAELEETLLHELAHLYNGPEHQNHGIRWRRIMRAACLERWGVWSNKRIRQDLDTDLAEKIRIKLSVKNKKAKIR